MGKKKGVSMSKKSKLVKKKRNPTGRQKQPQPKSQQKLASTASPTSWWWIGGIAAVLLVGAVALGCAVGPGKSTGKESPSMPTNPADRNNMYSAPPEMQIDPGKTYVATLSTAKGDIVVQLDASAAPLTVNNFVFLAEQGFYDGLTFHRVEPGFVIQGGDPAGTGGGGPGYTVPAEIQLPHVEGAIAMARLGDQVNPDRASSGSQFYITLAPTPFLDEGYTAFGHVIEGMEVVQSIAIGDVIEKITITEE
jgi:cyclophilin family peptidyl-prolyl cis-trans isomerase